MKQCVCFRYAGACSFPLELSLVVAFRTDNVLSFFSFILNIVYDLPIEVQEALKTAALPSIRPKFNVKPKRYSFNSIQFTFQSDLLHSDGQTFIVELIGD